MSNAIGGAGGVGGTTPNINITDSGDIQETQALAKATDVNLTVEQNVKSGNIPSAAIQEIAKPALQEPEKKAKDVDAQLLTSELSGSIAPETEPKRVVTILILLLVQAKLNIAEKKGAMENIVEQKDQTAATGALAAEKSIAKGEWQAAEAIVKGSGEIVNIASQAMMEVVAIVLGVALAVIGAVIGSLIPGLGTVIGGVVGAVAGTGTGTVAGGAAGVTTGAVAGSVAGTVGGTVSGATAGSVASSAGAQIANVAVTAAIKELGAKALTSALSEFAKTGSKAALQGVIKELAKLVAKQMIKQLDPTGLVGGSSLGKLKKATKSTIKEATKSAVEHGFKDQLKDKLKNVPKETIKSTVKEATETIKQEGKAISRDELQATLEQSFKEQGLEFTKSEIRDLVKSEVKKEFKAQLKEETKDMGKVEKFFTEQYEKHGFDVEQGQWERGQQLTDIGNALKSTTNFKEFASDKITGAIDGVIDTVVDKTSDFLFDQTENFIKTGGASHMNTETAVGYESDLAKIIEDIANKMLNIEEEQLHDAVDMYGMIQEQVKDVIDDINTLVQSEDQLTQRSIWNA